MSAITCPAAKMRPRTPETTGKKGRRSVQIGKYKVLDHIATGGMGAIYRAVDVELERPVALKVMAPELAANPVMLQRFRREARSAAKLRHQNIVAIYDIGEQNGLHFLALEFIDGMDLREYIHRQGQLAPEEGRQIVIQAARALEHAHKQGIVHRDIKPANFLISNKNGKLKVKLTDLGLARLTRDDEHQLTKPGTTLGTVDYISPEQARDGNSADIRSDIYSLGCTFFHMLAGNAPFAQGSMAERLLQHLETKAPDIRRLNKDVPESIALIVLRMLEKDPAARYQTPTELLKDLENPDGVRSEDKVEALARITRLLEEDGPSPEPRRRPKGNRRTMPLPPLGEGRRFRGDDDADAEAVLPSWLSSRPWLADILKPIWHNDRTWTRLRENWHWVASGIAVLLGLLILLIQFRNM